MLAALAILALAVAPVSSYAQGKDQAERIFFNAKVFTGVPDHPYAEAVAIRRDKIVAVGNLPDVLLVASSGRRRSTCKASRCFRV